MDHHLLLHCQSFPPSALLHHKSRNYIPIIPCSHVATIVLPCCRLAALIPPPPLLCCRRCPNAGRVRRRVTTKLPPPPLSPCRRHCHHQRRRCQPATASTKLPPLPLLKLQDKFDNEKEFCNNADIDCIQLSWLFRLGIEFLHGGMHPIFDALVYLSLYPNNL
jgi:hypothetical protein